jgi:hypothetical protein
MLAAAAAAAIQDDRLPDGSSPLYIVEVDAKRRDAVKLARELMI